MLIVRAQIGREPREPWRVGVRCSYGFPTVILSPSRLDDGTPFPSLAWLTCPWLAAKASAEESAGAAAQWAQRAAADPELAARVAAVDVAVRSARKAEGGGEDACEAVGLAGQRDPLGVKCLHAHAALALLGYDDPVGLAVLSAGAECDDRRCAHLFGRSDETDD